MTVPLSVMLPVLAVTSRLPPTLEAAMSMPEALTKVALPPAPVVLADRVPLTVRSVATMSALAAVVVKLALPPTEMAWVAVMPVAPPLVTLRLPRMLSVGSVMSAVLKFSVRLRRLIRSFSGNREVNVEPPRARSRTLSLLPLMVKTPPKALPPLPSSMSELGFSTATVTASPVVSVAPLACVMWLLEVTSREPPMLEVASTTACALFRTTLAPRPLVASAMAPVTFWLSTVIVAPEAVVV